MKRSKFSLSNYKLFTCDMGELVPCGVIEVLPGDSIQQATSALVRAAPLLSPVMHPVHVRIHHWFVPTRLIWVDFEKFITGGPDGLDTSVYPTIDPGGAGFAIGSLADYLGVPTGVTSATGRVVSALPFRAYNKIWNENYRDQDLETAVALSTASGVDATTSTVLKNVAWEKDYFTSARPWEQKGPAVTIPLVGQAPVIGIGYTGTTAAMNANVAVRETGGATPTYPWSLPSDQAGMRVKSSSSSTTTAIPQIFADLSGVSAVTVNTLRNALAIQRYEEARARFGSRYVEYLRYLGVKSSDARLDRPEYLGGGKQTIQFSEVLQTGTNFDANTGVGSLKGHGIGAMRSNRYRRFFEEHGYIISVMSTKPKTMYAQGMAKTWNRRFKEDFFQKELAHIGQQAVLNKEVYAAHTTPNGTFGYQDRYDEYRRTESSIAGEFRTTLDFWHMARLFTSDPALNATFVSSVPTERTFASPATDVLYIMASHSIQARRLVPGVGSSFIF